MQAGWGLRNAFAAALLVLLNLPASAGTTQSFTFRAENYAGSRDRQYKVYVPDGLGTPASMVMVLHGCQQTHDDVLQDWGMTAAADRFGFILVTPFITSYDGLRNTNCWGFWFDGHRHEGRGEPEDLHRIAREVEARFEVDPNRRYIAGLSSGAAMAVVAATTHNEYWTAAASAAGLPYGEESAAVSLSGQCPGFASFHGIDRVANDMRGELDDDYPIPLLVLQNEGDCTVLPAAGRNLRDAHLKAFGSPATARALQRACAPVSGPAYGCEHVFYTTDGTGNSRSVVETVFYNGPAATPNTTDSDHGHYWIGGSEGRDGRWSVRRGPSYPDIVWDFFARHPRDGTAPVGQPQITLNGASPMEIGLGQSFVDPGASASDPEDGELPVHADCSSVDTGRAGEYACVYTATDSAGNTSSLNRTVRVIDPSAPTPSCTVVNATPAAHIAAGRAEPGGFFALRAISSGDRRDIGFAWDFWLSVGLYEGESGQWYSVKPAECP